MVRLSGKNLCDFSEPKRAKSRDQAFKQEKGILEFLFRNFAQLFFQSGAEFLWVIANAVKDSSISMQGFKLMRNPSKTVKDDKPQS